MKLPPTKVQVVPRRNDVLLTLAIVETQSGELQRELEAAAERDALHSGDLPEPATDARPPLFCAQLAVPGSG